MANIVEEHKLILTEIGNNNNKFWHGKLYDDNTVYTEWGRVGYDGQNQTKAFSDSLAASKYLARKRGEKERKGYSVQRTLGAAPVKTAAANAIDHGGDTDTRKLLDYLVKVNIHNITSHTNISYDAISGTFTTPLGVVTADGIVDAETLLSQMADFVQKQVWDSRFDRLLSQYMRIVPTPIGMKRPVAQALYPDLNAIKAQQQILDSLRASLVALETQSTADNQQKQLYRAAIKLLTDDGGEGTAAFQHISKLFKGSLNAHHTSANLRLVRVYEIEIKGMTEAYRHDGAKLSNQWELWHGTRAANLLSIMNSGYVVPRSGGSIAVTGRMYGDGVYFSDQSTKSLNYSAGYWGGGRSEKTFMLLNDVAMGKYYVPTRSFSGGCRPGYDSTFAKANHSGVMNSEMIVYRTSQIRPKYLCEFGS